MVAGDTGADDTQYVLITQCMQNDFFLNLDCQLCLPEAAAARLLLDSEDESGFQVIGRRRELSERSRRASPLAQFLDAVVSNRISGKETRDNPKEQLDVLDQQLLQRIDDADFNAIRQLGVAPPPNAVRQR